MNVLRCWPQLYRRVSKHRYDPGWEIFISTIWPFSLQVPFKYVEVTSEKSTTLLHSMKNLKNPKEFSAKNEHLKTDHDPESKANSFCRFGRVNTTFFWRASMGTSGDAVSRHFIAHAAGWTRQTWMQITSRTRYTQLGFYGPMGGWKILLFLFEVRTMYNAFRVYVKILDKGSTVHFDANRTR